MISFLEFDQNSVILYFTLLREVLLEVGFFFQENFYLCAKIFNNTF